MSNMRIFITGCMILMIGSAAAQEKLSVSRVDNREYAPGYPSYSQTALQQLQQYPAPRLSSDAGMPRNFPWFAINYLNRVYSKGVTRPIENPEMAVALSEELTRFWNYYLEIPCLRRDSNAANAVYGNPATVEGALVKFANAHPEIPVATITYQLQNNGKHAGFDRSVYIKAQDLPAKYYMKDASGRPIISGGKKWLSPLMPLDIIRNDGLVARMYLRQLQKHLKQPISFINENGEAYGHNREEAFFRKDPAVATLMNKLKLPIRDFNGQFLNRIDSCYKATILEEPRLRNTKFSFYNVSYTQWEYWPDYRMRRNLNSKINGEYHSTPSVYVRKPQAWATSLGPANGFGRVADGREREIAIGEKWFSPFISAGWGLEENNIRPAQWLGLLKALGVLGADFYYTGYFNVTGGVGWPNGKGPNDPAGYAYQLAMPVYAQGITAMFKEFIVNGIMMNGDSKKRLSMFRFPVKNSNHLVIGRKMGNKYLLYGTVQNATNQLNAAPYSDVVSINVDGRQLSFEIRRQGSTYVLDLSNASKPVFYQLDGWHQQEHPSFWSKDIRIEGELANNNPAIATESKGLDFTSFTSYAALSKDNNVLRYNFCPRARTDLNCFIRARARSGSGSLWVQINSNEKVNCSVSGATWKWYKVPAGALKQIRPNVDNSLQVDLVSGEIEVDQVVFSSDKNIY